MMHIRYIAPEDLYFQDAWGHYSNHHKNKNTYIALKGSGEAGRTFRSTTLGLECG